LYEYFFSKVPQDLQDVQTGAWPRRFGSTMPSRWQLKKKPRPPLPLALASNIRLVKKMLCASDTHAMRYFNGPTATDCTRCRHGPFHESAATARLSPAGPYLAEISLARPKLRGVCVFLVSFEHSSSRDGLAADRLPSSYDGNALNTDAKYLVDGEFFAAPSKTL
jgi:hypothetical protein